MAIKMCDAENVEFKFPRLERHINPSYTKLFWTHTLYQGGRVGLSGPPLSHQHLDVQASNFAKY